jgi:DNA-binding beta-propeller fold protein YncE
MTAHLAARGRTAVCLLAAAVLAILAQMQSAAADEAAVVFQYAMRATGPAALGYPESVAVDALGNVYVADTTHHRIVKFDKYGDFVRAFGTEGFEPGNLYYPVGITVGDLPSGSTGVYVTQYHYLSVFSTGGTFLRRYGGAGTVTGELNTPYDVDTVLGLPQAGLYVSEPRSNRVQRFNLNGKLLQTFPCPDCPPGGGWGGIALRKLETGGWQLYASDAAKHKVQVLTANGALIRSLGSGNAGSADGDIALPMGVAVDSDDGSAYVVDNGFGNERVSKFSASGQFLFSFNSNGIANFVQPHGVALDQRGNIYVANTGASQVYKFALRPPRLSVGVLQSSDDWAAARAAKFGVRYNGVERTCSVSGSARLTVPAAGGGNRVFTLTGRVGSVGARAKSLTMRMTNQQAGWIYEAPPGATQVRVALNGNCEGLRLTAQDDFNV